jgi:hypothetical protein
MSGESTVANLDKLAEALDVHISALFMKPKPGERRAKPLQPGRKPII